MPRYISCSGDCYGIWSDGDGTITGDAVPAAKKVGDVAIKIAESQKAHQASAKNKK